MNNPESYHISLKLIIKNSAGQILGLEGAAGGTYDGFYDLPGGRIDVDEFQKPIEEILKREVSEELGDVEVFINQTPVAMGRHLILKHHTSAKIKDIPVMYIFFEAEILSGEINVSNEHQSLKWIDLTEQEINKYFISGLLEGLKMYLLKAAQ